MQSVVRSKYKASTCVSRNTLFLTGKEEPFSVQTGKVNYVHAVVMSQEGIRTSIGMDHKPAVMHGAL